MLVVLLFVTVVMHAIPGPAPKRVILYPERPDFSLGVSVMSREQTARRVFSALRMNTISADVSEQAQLLWNLRCAGQCLLADRVSLQSSRLVRERYCLLDRELPKDPLS